MRTALNDTNAVAPGSQQSNTVVPSNRTSEISFLAGILCGPPERGSHSILVKEARRAAFYVTYLYPGLGCYDYAILLMKHNHIRWL